MKNKVVRDWLLQYNRDLVEGAKYNQKQVYFVTPSGTMAEEVRNYLRSLGHKVTVRQLPCDPTLVEEVVTL